MKLTVVSSGSQLLFSISLLFHFKSKNENEFNLEIRKVGHLKKTYLPCEKWNYCIPVPFSLNAWSTQGCKCKILGEMLEFSLKYKSQSHISNISKKYFGLHTIKV